MSQYKKVMQTKGIQQKEVLDAVHRVDARVDKPLLSKIVNDVCLPTPQQFKVICDTLVCAPSDIYDRAKLSLCRHRRQIRPPQMYIRQKPASVGKTLTFTI